MSLKLAAQHLQAQGRGPDTELVHMTKDEVKGLQTLAKAHGGSLSINPNTGLAEAGFLSNILPTVAGITAGVLTGNPMIGAAVGGGLGYATTGNLQQGLMAGLGSYGGAGAFGGIESAGAAANLSEYAPQASEAGTQALRDAGFQYGANGPITPQDVGQYVSSGQITQDQAKLYGDAYSKVYSGAPSSLAAGLGSSAGWKNAALPLGMLALGAIGSTSGNTGGAATNPSNSTPGTIRPYTYSQTKNPNFGQPGQPYFNQSYTAKTPYTAADGGLMSIGGQAQDQTQGQNQMYPGSQQVPSQYAIPSQAPISSSALNASYEAKTDPYTGEMKLASGGIASIQRYDDGGQAQETPKTESTWKPTDPVKLQSMDQMLSGDASGKSYNPTEHGYKWNGAGFVNPNGATLSVDQNGTVTQALPSHKDYEFNGKYWNPAGENIAWHPETSTTAYKVDGVEVPIERQATKGIAAFTDAKGKPQMQMNKEGLPVFTEPEGLKQSKLFMDEYGAPALAGLALGGAGAFGSGAIGAGTTLAGEGAASAGGAGAVGSENVFSGFSPTGSSAGYAGSSTPGAFPGVSSADLGMTATNAASNAIPNAVPPAGSLMPNSNQLLTAYLASQALGGRGAAAGTGGEIGTPYQAAPTMYIPQYNSTTHQYAAEGGIMGTGYAAGGMSNLGGYSDGGQLLKGPGDGVSDGINAVIGNKQPARLADGEFVIPARIVSELGNGSTDAGAKRLYEMMDRVQHSRKKSIGKGKVAVNSKAYKNLPK